MHLISENERKSLDSYLDSLKQSVDMVALMAEDSLDELEGDVAEVADDHPDEFDAFMKAHCDTVQKAFRSTADNTAGVETYYYCVNSDLGSSEHGFFFSKVGRESYEEQPDLISTELDPEDTEHSRWYFAPIESGEPAWVGPYKAHFLDEVWTVSYVIPVYKGDSLIGVLGMDILLDTLVKQISSVKVYDTGFITLLDSSGHILYHPELSIGVMPEIVSDSLNAELFRKDNTGDMLIRYKMNGVERQLAFSTLSNGLKLCVSAPVSEINAMWRHLIMMILIVSAVLLLVFSFLIMLSLGFITKPLLTLTAASRRLAAGDYDAELSYEGRDEVGVLTGSFRQMRDQLKLYITDLNSRAYSDALTGVKNKGAFDIYLEKLNEAIGDKDSGDLPEFAIVMFDCNNLKRINDEYGHERGDIYLRTACQVICRSFSRSPVFRIGGDEFVVILQNEDYIDRDKLISGYESTVSEVNASADSPWNTVNLSMGIAVYMPDQDSGADSVFHRADVKMYEDKSLYKAKAHGNGEG